MNWEVGVLQYLESIRTPFLTAVMEAITMLAEPLILLVVLSILYWCVDKRKTRKMVWIVLMSQFMNSVIKDIVKALRPFEVGVVLPLRPQTAGGYSFPSGHTQAATSFWGSAMVVLKNKKIVLVGSVFIVLTAFTRLYLGVHWPKDVLAGILFGALFVLLGDILLDEEKGFSAAHVLVVSVAVIICILFGAKETILGSIGGLWGVVVGGYWEAQRVKFKEHAPLATQIKKIVVGLVGTGAVYWAVGKLVPVNEFATLLQYSVTTLWMMVGAPYVFTKWFPNKI